MGFGQPAKLVMVVVWEVVGHEAGDGARMEGEAFDDQGRQNVERRGSSLELTPPPRSMLSNTNPLAL